MDILERVIVRSHAVVLQVIDGAHAVLRMLCKHGGQLFGAIVAVVEEYHHMAGTDASVDGIVDNRLDEFVGHSLGIAFLHGP